MPEYKVGAGLDYTDDDGEGQRAEIGDVITLAEAAEWLTEQGILTEIVEVEAVLVDDDADPEPSTPEVSAEGSASAVIASPPEPSEPVAVKAGV